MVIIKELIIMATIEERAVQAFPHNRFHRYAYSKGATEQDRIARAEERERCVIAAQLFFCDNFCDNYVGCRACNLQEKIRKAIEEGGEG